MTTRTSSPEHGQGRAAFVAYFLGAVLPLVTLGFVLERHVLPGVSDRLVSLGLIGLALSLTVLSLGSFFVLRRTTLRSIARMDRDNHHLAALLEVAGSLAGEQHAADAAATTAKAALALTGAEACFVLMRGQPGAAPERLAAAGADAEKLEQRCIESIVGMANLVLSTGRPAVRGSDGEHPALLASPLPGELMPAGVVVAVAPPEATESESLGVLATLGGLAAVALRNTELRDAQRNFFTHVTDILVSALDTHLGYHSGHGMRVAHLANRIARRMQLDEHRMQRLHFSALLHDIGMLKLERQLQTHRRHCTKHATLGARMLSRIRLWEELAPIVERHHERWDGSGYPGGLSGDAIPLESRIIALCDVFDTVASEESYRDAMPFAQAVHEVEAGAGTQFDPEIVGVFAALVRDGEIGPDALT